MSSKCACLKKGDGKPCEFKAKPGSKFCGTHKNCVNSVVQKVEQAQQLQTSSARKPKPKAPKLQRGQVGINTAAWKLRKPSSKAQKQQMEEKCGNKCYLIPGSKKYTVCAKGSCNYDCDGIRAARNMTYYVANRKNATEQSKKWALDARELATALGKEHCNWT